MGQKLIIIRICNSWYRYQFACVVDSSVVLSICWCFIISHGAWINESTSTQAVYMNTNLCVFCSGNTETEAYWKIQQTQGTFFGWAKCYVMWNYKIWLLISSVTWLSNESYNMTRHLASSNPSLRKGGKRMPQRITDTCHTEGQPIASNKADDLRVFWLLKKCISFSSIFC